MDWKILAILSGIYFEEPARLSLLSAVPALFILWLFIWFLRLKLRPAKTSSSTYSLLGSLRLWLAIIMSLPLLIGAWAKPFLPQGDIVARRGNAEIIFVVDYSASMFLQDTEWARIDIARREVLRLISGEVIREGDKVALSLLQFAGLPPRLYLTEDLSAFANEVSQLGRPKSLASSQNYWGSNVDGTLEKLYQSIDRHDIFIGTGQLNAPSGWRPRARQNRLVIVLTDGDFFSDMDSQAESEARQKLSAALYELKRRGVPIYPVGIGTYIGAPLTDILRDYRELKDYDAKLPEELAGQTSRLRPENLEMLKDATGGDGPFLIQNYQGDAGGFMKSAIDRHRSTTVELSSSQQKSDLWLHFLLAALVIFVAGMGFYVLMALIGGLSVWYFLL